MKKFIMLFICIFTGLLSVTAFGAEELRFEPVGGGKFIYCNNPEGIEDDMLLNAGTPVYIMNNEELAPDKYYIYLSHFNFTGSGKLGYDIELDLKMIAREDSKITIRKAFFETPQEYAYYKNQSRTPAETDWGQLQVCADMLGVPMCKIRGEDLFYPREFEPVTLDLKAGESVWLSEYLSNYEAIHFSKAVHIQAFVEIESGLMDFNVGAVKSNGIVGYRYNVPETPGFGEYRWDYTLKGIADSLPEVRADIEYTIDENTADGERIPIFLKNQYAPEGHTVTEWYTQLNPQNDIWSKTTAAESDILPLYYKDNSKLGFYGSAVPDTERDNIWRFDTVHSAVRKYDAKYKTGAAKDFIPNFTLGTDTDNHEYACNIGNYGVATTYNLSVANETDKTKYCSLVLTAASEVIAYETEADGSRDYACVKDLTSDKVSDVMLSHEIPPHSAEKFEFSIILPVNYNGGIKNELVINDKKPSAVEFEKRAAEVEAEHQKTDYRLTNEIHGEYIEEVYPLLPDETASKVKNNKESFEYLRGRDNALVRWCAWDGAPYWYYNLWGYANTVYNLDKENNIINSYAFPSLPCEAVWNNGYFYVKTAADGVYKSADGADWIKTGEPLPNHEPFYDLENASDWAEEELEQGWDLGLRVKRYGIGYNFRTNISREDFCELAAGLLGKLEIGGGSSETVEFNDTENPSVERLASVGIIKGFGDGTFRPADWLTREQAAVILARLTDYAAKESAVTELPQSDERRSWADGGLISDWAADGIECVYRAGIMRGVGEDMFEPQGGYSVEQSAVTILRAYEYLRESLKITH